MKPNNHRSIPSSSFARAPGLGGGVPSPQYVQPRKAPGIPVLKVVGCPECSAEIGERCKNKKGDLVVTPHVSRRRRAARIYNEQRAKEAELNLPEGEA